MRTLDLHDAAVGRRQHRIGRLRNRAFRVAEELRDKGDDDPRQDGEQRMRPPRQRGGDDDRDREERPAFAGEEGMRIVVGHARELLRCERANYALPDPAPPVSERPRRLQ